MLLCAWLLLQARATCEALIKRLAPPLMQFATPDTLQQWVELRQHQQLLGHWDKLAFSCSDLPLGSVAGKLEQFQQEALADPHMQLLWQATAALAMANYTLQTLSLGVEQAWQDAVEVSAQHQQRQQQLRARNRHLQQTLQEEPKCVETTLQQVESAFKCQVEALQGTLAASSTAALAAGCDTQRLGSQLESAGWQRTLQRMLEGVSQQLQKLEHDADDTAVDAALQTFKASSSQLRLAKALVEQWSTAAGKQPEAASGEQKPQPQGGAQAAAFAAAKTAWELEQTWTAVAPAAWLFADFVTQAQQQCHSIRQHAAELHRLVQAQPQLGAGPSGGSCTGKQWQQMVLYCVNSACIALDDQATAEEELAADLQRYRQQQQKRLEKLQAEGAPAAAVGTADAVVEAAVAAEQVQKDRRRAVEEAYARASDCKKQLKQQQPPWHKLGELCSQLAEVEPVLSAQWFAAAEPPAASWWVHGDDVTPCAAPMTPAYWAAWQPRFLQYLQAQRQGLDDRLNQHAAQWLPTGEAGRTHWHSQLVDGVATAGHFLPNMDRCYVGSFRANLRRALSYAQQDGSREQLVQPLVQHWPAGSRAFLAPLAYAFTEVRPSASVTCMAGT
jgi:hypothetical protein